MTDVSDDSDRRLFYLFIVGFLCATVTLTAGLYMEYLTKKSAFEAGYEQDAWGKWVKKQEGR